MDRLLRLGGGMPGLGQGTTPSDGPVVDTAEQVYISSLALLKVKLLTYTFMIPPLHTPLPTLKCAQLLNEDLFYVRCEAIKKVVL